MLEPTPNHIYTGDCLEVMRTWPDDCIDHCIADPPFGIASGRGRGGSKKGLGWAFSSHVTMQESWDQFTEDEYYRFTLEWLREVCRVVKPNGNILVFGTFHNIYLLGFLLGHVLERRILNSIVWFKPNAQPNITTRMLTESTEHIIWAVNETPKRAKKWTFNYSEAKELNGHKQMRNMWNRQGLDIWQASVAPSSERKHGNHPAQKPRAVVDRLIEIFTRKGQRILDPFAGTGVVALSASAYLREYVLIEKSPTFVRAAKRRLQEQKSARELAVIQLLGDAVMSLNDAELRIIQSVPVPQADILEKVFEVVELVDQGIDSEEDMAEYLEMVSRQGPYYAEAAVALRLIGVQKDITADSADRFYVTPLGREYLEADSKGRVHKRRFAVLNSPIMKYVSSRLGLTNNGTMVPYPPPAELTDESKVGGILQELGLSGKTLGRRAHTFKAWIESV